MKSLIAKIRTWYVGEYHPQEEQTPDGTLHVRAEGYYEKSTSSKIANRMVKFWCDHWQWILGSIAALVVFYFKYLR
jgi:hypothetical protein